MRFAAALQMMQVSFLHASPFDSCMQLYILACSSLCKPCKLLKEKCGHEGCVLFSCNVWVVYSLLQLGFYCLSFSNCTTIACGSTENSIQRHRKVCESYHACYDSNLQTVLLMKHFYKHRYNKLAKKHRTSKST